MTHSAQVASNQATADHKLRRCKVVDSAWYDSDSNMVVACFQCNYEKRPPDKGNQRSQVHRRTKQVDTVAASAARTSCPGSTGCCV